MHWSPLAGVLPMVGVKGLTPPKKHKSPKMKIVAKVHVPKGHTEDNGYFDYDLLDKLLFPEEGSGSAKSANARTKETVGVLTQKEREAEKRLRAMKNDLDDAQ